MTNEQKEKIWDVATAIVVVTVITAVIVLVLNACTVVNVNSVSDEKIGTKNVLGEIR